MTDQPTDEQVERVAAAIATALYENRLSSQPIAYIAARAAIAAMQPTPTDDYDWPDIPDTPEQRALIAQHNADIWAKYPDMKQIDPPPITPAEAARVLDPWTIKGIVDDCLTECAGGQLVMEYDEFTRRFHAAIAETGQ